MTCFVGIDNAKFKHVCFIINELGEVIRNSFSFPNNSSRFNEVLSTRKSLNFQDLKIGLETTAYYGMNLKLFLESNNFSFMGFNPILVELFSKTSSLERTKTDKKDAPFIASYLFSIKCQSYQSQSYQIYSLKSLTRFIENLLSKDYIPT